MNKMRNYAKNLSVAHFLIFFSPLLAFAPIEETITPSEEISESVADHASFLNTIGFLESSNNYKAVNKYGYWGKYQFGKIARIDVGLDIDKRTFLNSPDIQELAMQRLLQNNAHYLRREISKFEGKTVHGVMITKSGLLAAAHLGGATNVKKFLYSGKDFKDANGTSIKKYLKLFQGYRLNIE